jgi:hypothetical protein
MKTRTSPTGLFASLGAASLVALGASAQTPAPAAPPAPAATAAATVKLPYGVDDVLKLSRAQISEDVIINYIRSSGTIYNLSPNNIVYLRSEGVSDHVVNTMLDQRNNVPAATAAAQTTSDWTTPQPAQPPPATMDASAAAAPQYAPAYAAPQPAPAAPASTVYVIPYAGGGYGYANYYYPYRGYYPFYGPAVGFGVGVGVGVAVGVRHGYYGGSYYHGGHYGGGSYGHGGHR